MRDEGTFRPRIKPVSLPRTSSKSPIPKGLPFISPATAAAQLATWRAEAARQGYGEVAGRNARRTVTSLFDASGVLAQPWVDAGCNVITYDLQTGGDISQFDAENLLEQHGNDDVWDHLLAVLQRRPVEMPANKAAACHFAILLAASSSPLRMASAKASGKSFGSCARTR